MSLAAISPSSLFDVSNQNVFSHREQIQQEFQQLGQDLQSGDLTAAQTDFTTLQQLVPKLASIPTAASDTTTATSATSNAAPATTSTVESADPRVQAFAQLEQDIQAANTSAAQQDYSNIQQIFAQRAAEHNNHRQHLGGFNGAPGGVSALPGGFGQLFQQLGQALQSGDLSAAQQAYSSLRQDFLQSNQSPGAQSQAGSPSVSLTA